MSGIQEIVVQVNDEVSSSPAIELAGSLAPTLGAHLSAVLIGAQVNMGLGLSAETASLARQLEQAQHAERLGIGQRLVTRMKQRHGLALELRFADGDPVAALQAHTRTADLLITSQRDPAREGGLSTAQSARLLVGSACPVLTVPYVGLTPAGATDSAAQPLRRALVAWSDSRESARALRDSLPLLSLASYVEVVTFASVEFANLGPSRAALDRVVSYLRSHAVVAIPTVLSQANPSMSERMLRGGLSDVAAAEALLSHAADMSADFIVMGGYGHSRLWELVLGGVTRTMLESMTVPVLMSN
jgi:nucleotide-binding universal stress UspA family protein